MTTDPSIFKAYDIRGVYPNQFNEEVGYSLGRAFATLLISENSSRSLSVAVSSDMRVSSPLIKPKVIQGLIDSGVNVVDIGMSSTPTFYFGVAYFGYDGGIQVSASHNPKEYNGAKLVRKNAVPVSKDSGMFTVRDFVVNNNFCPLVEQKGKLSKNTQVLEKEKEEARKVVDTKGFKPLKIVIDAANAMGSIDVESMFEGLPCKLIKINFDLDGTFPSHEADPMKPENTKMLCDRVLEEKADLGIAPDGDGDRYFFADENGRMIPQAILRGLMAQIELKEHPKATVAYDIRPGRITQDMIDELGGRAVVTPVGHSLIKEMMIKEGAIFGGESSGHYFYKFDYGTFEAPFLLVYKLLKHISDRKLPFSEVIKPFQRYAHSGEINTKVASREIVNEIIDQIKQKYSDTKQIYIDGVTVEYLDVWFNVRASNTEPLIRLTVEARSEELMKQKTDELLAIIRK